ncbi:MAG: tyrosine-type recombinase/integrase [Phycisphaerae bacterium]|nr:tyrosine-type recombinase/integrase [Phycisphaerae bacterium]
MSVFKPTYATELPEDATIHKSRGRCYINIKDHNSRTVKAFLTKDGKSYLKPQRNYAGRYNDYHGKRRTITLCQEKEASQAALNELVKYIQLLRAHRAIPPLNEISPMIRDKVQEALIASGQETQGDQLSRKPLKQLFDLYSEDLQASGTTEEHRKEVKRCLKAIVSDCGFQYLKDICQPPVKEFINKMKDKGLSDRTVNVYVDRLRYFCNWAYQNRLLSQNPFVDFTRLDEKTNRVREARSLMPDEVEKLLDGAYRRPLEKRQGKYKNIRPATIRKYQLNGEERRLAYALMLYTGLRVNEVRQLVWNDINLNKRYIKVRSTTTKNAKPCTLPMHEYIQELLEAWKENQPDAKAKDRVVNVPASNSSFLKAFNRDLDFAGIDKKDELDRVVHLHSLRHSFCSLLASQGVYPHILKKLARHSDIQTTMSYYTHVLHGDDVQAIDRLYRPEPKQYKTRKKRTG